MVRKPTVVLLIEDNPGDAHLIRFMLEQAYSDPIVVEHRPRLSDGLERLADDDIDVVLLDLYLPDSKGLASFSTLYNQVPELPIVLLTGFSDEALALEAMRHGAQDYLVKGQVDGDTLRRALHYAIERKRGEVALATRLRYEEGVAACSQALLTSRDAALALHDALEHLLFASKASRVAVFENQEHPDLGLCMNLSYSAHRSDVAAFENDPRLLDLPYKKSWRERLAAGEPLYGPTGDLPRPFCDVLRDYGIYSILILPVFVGEAWYGFIAFGARAESRTWSGEDIRLLHTAADMIGTFIQTRRDAQTKSALLREVNHRVKNNLSAIIGFLYAEQSRADIADRPVYQSIMRELITRVQGLSTVHSMLSASEWAPLPLSDLAIRVIQSVLDLFSFGPKIAVSVTPSSLHVTSDQAHHLALVINELTTNVIKHALTENGQARIDIRISEQLGLINFEFRDYGPGYPKSVLRLEHHNVGFDLIGGIVHQNLSGTLSLFNDEGAVAIIQFPSKRG